VSWGGEVIDVYVGLRQMMFWQGTEGLGAQAVADGLPDLAAGLKATGKRLRRWPHTRVRVWLSGAWALPFVMQPVAGLRNWREALAAAGAVAGDQTGWAKPAAVWLDSVPQQHAALGVAAAQPVLAALNRGAAEVGVRLQSVRPWWALALDEARRDGDGVELLAAEDSDALILLSATGEHWREAAAYAPKPVAQQAEAVVQRRAMAQGIAAERVRRSRLAGCATAPGSLPGRISAAIVSSFTQEAA